MKRLALVSATALALVMSACSKNDGKDGEKTPPPGQSPGLDAVAPSFKNTAKTGKDVATRLDAVASRLAQSDLTMRNAPRADSRGLKIAKMNSFLMESDPQPQETTGGPKVPGETDFADGADCGKVAGQISQAYAASVESLKTAAQSLRTWEDGALPEGVTRNPADAKFAVSYSVNLEKLLAQGGTVPMPSAGDGVGGEDDAADADPIPPIEGDGSDSAEEDSQSPPAGSGTSWPMPIPGRETDDAGGPGIDSTTRQPPAATAGDDGRSSDGEDFPSFGPTPRGPARPTSTFDDDTGSKPTAFGPGNLTGSLVFGVGASETEVGAELSLDVGFKAGEEMSTTSKLGIAAYANESTQEVKTRTSYALDQTSEEGTSNAVGSFDLTLRGGANAAVFVQASAKSSAGFGEQDAATEASLDVRIEKQSDSELLVTYGLVANGKTHAAKARLVTDASGTCVVKHELSSN